MTWFDYDEQNLSRFFSVSFANKGFCLIEVSVKKELPVVVKWRHRANHGLLTLISEKWIDPSLEPKYD